MFLYCSNKLYLCELESGCYGRRKKAMLYRTKCYMRDETDRYGHKATACETLKPLHWAAVSFKVTISMTCTEKPKPYKAIPASPAMKCRQLGRTRSAHWRQEGETLLLKKPLKRCRCSDCYCSLSERPAAPRMTELQVKGFQHLTVHGAGLCVLKSLFTVWWL